MTDIWNAAVIVLLEHTLDKFTVFLCSLFAPSSHRVFVPSVITLLCLLGNVAFLDEPIKTGIQSPVIDRLRVELFKCVLYCDSFCGAQLVDDVECIQLECCEIRGRL